MGRSFKMPGNPHKVYHMNTRANFSKKYPGKRIEDLWKDDPDYLVYCYDTLGLNLAKDVKDLVENYKRTNKKRGITKVTRFKS